MKLYKYRSDIYRDLLTLIGNQIYAPTAQKLNDPCETLVNDSSIYKAFEFLEKFGIPLNEVKDSYTGIMNQARKELGVFSLSRNLNNELLWAYYSNGHLGFCIEYNYNILIESFSDKILHSAFDVDYKNNIPEFSIDNITSLTENPIQFIKSMIGTKSEAWKHEEEIRIILFSSGLIDVPPEVVTGIYFGIRMLESDKIIIRKSLQCRDIKYYQMKLKPNSYILEYELIK